MGSTAVRGFTLVETLVALTIAAVAASVVLGHVHSLLQRAEREHSHQLAALQLLNDSLRLSYGGLAGFMPPRLDKDRLVIDAVDTAHADLPRVEVRNFSVRGESLPPVEFAFTPFQTFSVTRDRYALHAVGPAVKAPEGVAQLPDEAVPLETPSAAPDTQTAP